MKRPENYMLDEFEAIIHLKWSPILYPGRTVPVYSQLDTGQTSSCKQLIWKHPPSSSENFLP
jgi:hypothetical protein